MPLGRRTTLSLTHFEDIDTAVAAVPALVAAGASATELMVAPTLIAAAWNMPGTPARWKELPPTSAALLVEFRAEEAAALDEPRAGGARDPPRRATRSISRRFSRERHEVEMLWRVREGMQGLLAAMRGPGVSLIIEDVCVPPARIAEAAKDLQQLLDRHNFLPGVAGHASAGNLHFLLTPNFGEQADLDRYEAFMGDLVELIVDRYDGSLKAEHGTGINMAPYVEREWGAKATEMMWRIKRLADPDGILGPGIVLSEDKGAHLRNLKSAPQIEAVANQCIECGFCEPACPSRDLTTTPRQRIVLRREMARQREDSPVLAGAARAVRLRRDGDLRGGRHLQPALPGRDRHRQARQVAARAKPRPGRRTRRAGGGPALGHGRTGGTGRLRAGRTIGDGASAALTGIARTAAGAELIPAWGGEAMPDPASPIPWTATGGRGGRLLPGLREPHLRQPPRAALAPLAARGAALRLGPCRKAAVDPPGPGRAVLRHPMELEGLHRRAIARWPAGSPGRSSSGPRAAGCRSSSMRAHAPTGCSPRCRRRSPRSSGRRSRLSRSSTRSPGCATRCSTR